MSGTKKKILLVNPSAGFRGDGYIPHLGLAYLSGVIKNSGNKVLVLDYNGRKGLPDIETVMQKKFTPDIIGLSSYCASWSAASIFLDRLQKYSLPIIVGGPHASCCKNRLLSDRRIDCVITGEAEGVILGAIENIRKTSQPALFEGIPLDTQLQLYPDFTDFYLSGEIDSYPLITSRGCPFECSFCAVAIVSAKKWRPRSIDSCIEELRSALKIFPRLKRIIINDDNFSLDLGRAKYFLSKLIGLKSGVKLEVSNVRADKIDEEFILLLKNAGCRHIGIGIEHPDPEVYNHIGKAEKMEDIIKAARMIKKHNIRLAACMVIGLPNDSLEKVRKAIRFVKEIKADSVFWNMVYPFNGTRVEGWFREKGKIFNEGEQGFTPRNRGILIDDPVVETAGFTRGERRRAYTMAVLETGMYSYRDLARIMKSLPYIFRNRLMSSFLKGFIYGFSKRLNRAFANIF